MSALRIVLADGGSLARYPQGGGHWSCLLQYCFGLQALRHDVFWLEVLESSGDAAKDARQVKTFCRRFDAYGLADRYAVLVCRGDPNEAGLEQMAAYGLTRKRIREIAASADILWDFACGLRRPLLSLFRRRVLLDLDPGHLQVAALTWDMGIHDHDTFLTVGTKMHEPDCQAPTLGLRWQRFLPFVHLPMWNVAPDPGKGAPFTSVTQWTWEELEYDGRSLSVSKRDGYLKYLGLPERAARPFELAANIHADDRTGDRETLLDHGWKLVDPHKVAATVGAYRSYVRRSRAEFQCPKPIHRQLKTGWFSDRSACYLASGRPVLAEETGCGDLLPTGRGLLSFRNLPEAAAGAAEIDANYPLHMRAARELAEEYLSAEKCLPAMLSACGC